MSRFKIRSRCAGSLGLLLTFFLCSIALDVHSAGPRKIAGRLLVKPKPHVSQGQLQALLASHGAQERSVIQQIDVRIVSVTEARSDAVLTALRHNPNIEFAEYDLLLEPDTVPNDTYYSLEWHLPKIEAPAAWDIAMCSSNVIIAILDSGVDSTHPDLVPVLVPGWNFFDNNSDTSDVTGHGTAVAGQAGAASDNGTGVASTAWGGRIMPIRVSDTNGYGSLSAMASGLTYAADHAARVANISFGASGSFTVSNASAYFQSKGGVVTISAGNEGVFDASVDNPFVLTVSATDANDVLASFSNTGNNIDVAAPGVNIITTTRGGGYGSGTGTSASAPIVAGVAALAIAANPNLTGLQVQDIIKQSADDLGPPGWDTSYGWGRVNAYRAVLAAIATPGDNTNAPPDTAPPSAAITAPASGSVVAGVVIINVSATDDVGVTRVECDMNGALAGTNATAPAAFSWDTSSYTNGSYTLRARAYDVAGNMGSSALVTVTVNNVVASDVTAPTVAITSPTTGSTLTGKKKDVYVKAADNVGVTRVDLLVDGKFYATSSSASPVFTWMIGKLTRGTHFLQAVAYDAAGNSTRSGAVTVYK